MSSVDEMGVTERWWRVRAQNGRTTWLDVDPEAEGMMQGAWHRAEVAGPFVLEAQQPQGAVEALEWIERFTSRECPTCEGSGAVYLDDGEGGTDSERCDTCAGDGRVVPASDREGAVDALDEAVKAARLFNRSGITWMEYDRLLARLEGVVNHARGQS
jgi:hypothetical protein